MLDRLVKIFTSLVNEIRMNCGRPLAERPGTQVIDLASMLAAADNHSPPWYFPNEGHLTPQGHQLVAQLLREKLHGLLAAADDRQ